MRPYRIYELNAVGRIHAAPIEAHFATDDLAVSAALLSLQLVGQTVEIWQGSRLVAALPRYEKPEASVDDQMIKRFGRLA